MSRKIIIREEQIDTMMGGVDKMMRYAIALWCLMNDFRYLSEGNIFGRRVSVANTERINREICLDILNANDIHEVENNGMFDDDSKIYSVDGMLIEVSDDLSPDYMYSILRRYRKGEIDDEYIVNLLEWFHSKI